MSTESVGAEESGYLFNRTEYAVMVGRDFVKSGPGFLRIDGDIFEAGYAVGGAVEDLLDECRVKVGLKARGFFRVVPGEQEAEAFGAEVKAIGHIDDHWNVVRDPVKRFRWNELAAQWLDWEINSGESSDLPSPSSAGIDH